MKNSVIPFWVSFSQESSKAERLLGKMLVMLLHLMHFMIFKVVPMIAIMWVFALVLPYMIQGILIVLGVYLAFGLIFSIIKRIF